MKYLRGFLKESIDNIPIIDYSKSKSVILVGKKTNIFRDIFRMYQHKIDGDDVHFFQSDYHFATLFKQGSFYEIKHDGSIDENGRRIIDTGKLKREVDEWMFTITDNYQYDSSLDYVKVVRKRKFVLVSYKNISLRKEDYITFLKKVIRIFRILERDLSLVGLLFIEHEVYPLKISDLERFLNEYEEDELESEIGGSLTISFKREIKI